MREGGSARVKTVLHLITITGDDKGKREIISQKAAGVLPVEQETNSRTFLCVAILVKWTGGTFKPPAAMMTVMSEVCGDRMQVACSFLAACTQLFPDRGHET